MYSQVCHLSNITLLFFFPPLETKASRSEMLNILTHTRHAHTPGLNAAAPLLLRELLFVFSSIFPTPQLPSPFPPAHPHPPPPCPSSMLAVGLGGNTGAVSYQQSHCARTGHSNSHAGGAHCARTRRVRAGVPLVGVGAHVALELRGRLALHPTQLA